MGHLHQSLLIFMDNILLSSQDHIHNMPKPKKRQSNNTNLTECKEVKIACPVVMRATGIVAYTLLRNIYKKLLTGTI